MNTKLFTRLSTRFLRAGIPLVVAIMLMGAIWGGRASNASTIESVFSNQQPSMRSSGNIVTIGVAADMSGPADWIGWRQVNAVELAVTQVNAAGGIDVGGTNYSLALATADGECSQTQAITATNTLLAAGAVAVVGHTCSFPSDVAQPVYAAAGVSMVSASSTLPHVTEQGYTTTFRVISRDDIPPDRLGAYLRDSLYHERAAIIEFNGFWGNWAGDVFSDTFTSMGGTITSRNAVDHTDDFTDTLTTIMAENPDAIFFPFDDGSTAGFLGAVADNVGMTGVVIAWNTHSHARELLDHYAASAGSAAEGDIASMYYRAADDMPGYTTLNSDYVDAGFSNHGDEVQEWGAFAYDAAMIIIAAIDRADSTDPADIRDEIAATSNLQGVVGTYLGFDDKGDVIPQWTWLEQYQGGRWTVIWPHRVFVPVALKT